MAGSSTNQQWILCCLKVTTLKTEKEMVAVKILCTLKGGKSNQDAEKERFKKSLKEPEIAEIVCFVILIEMKTTVFE